MVRYQRGDRNALSVIVRRHARQVYATAFGIAGNAQLATDLTENTFLALVGQAGNFHIEMHFRSWLFGFLHQHIIDRCHIPTDSAPGDEYARNAAGGRDDDAEPEPIQAISRSGRSQLLSRRIAECTLAMSLLEREALVMKLTAQLTLAELATAIATDGETVRSRLRAALERLRASISDTEDYARALR